MIILSFCVFALMLIWCVVSALAVALGCMCLDSPSADGRVLIPLFGGIFSLVCWYQVLVWGEPWFKVLAQAWM